MGRAVVARRQLAAWRQAACQSAARPATAAGPRAAEGAKARIFRQLCRKAAKAAGPGHPTPSRAARQSRRAPAQGTDGGRRGRGTVDEVEGGVEEAQALRPASSSRTPESGAIFGRSVRAAGGDQGPVGVSRLCIAREGPDVGDGGDGRGIAFDHLALAVAGDVDLIETILTVTTALRFCRSASMISAERIPTSVVERVGRSSAAPRSPG